MIDDEKVGDIRRLSHMQAVEEGKQKGTIGREIQESDKSMLWNEDSQTEHLLLNTKRAVLSGLIRRSFE
jgi:hypothetical protein